MKWHKTIYKNCTTVNSLVLMVSYNFVRCDLWRKISEECMGPLCTIFAIFCESIITLKNKILKEAVFVKTDFSCRTDIMGIQPVYVHRASQKRPEPALMLCSCHLKFLGF